MTRMAVHEAKAHFSELLRRVEAGETITVTRHNRVVAEIKPAEVEDNIPILGFYEGAFEAPDEAFAPLTEEELKDWFGD